MYSYDYCYYTNLEGTDRGDVGIRAMPFGEVSGVDV